MENNGIQIYEDGHIFGKEEAGIHDKNRLLSHKKQWYDKKHARWKNRHVFIRFVKQYLKKTLSRQEFQSNHCDMIFAKHFAEFFNQTSRQGDRQTRRSLTKNHERKN